MQLSDDLQPPQQLKFETMDQGKNSIDKKSTVLSSKRSSFYNLSAASHDTSLVVIH